MKVWYYWLSFDFHISDVVTWLLLFGLVYTNIALLPFQILTLSLSKLHIQHSVHINSLQGCYQITLSTDSCVTLPTGSHWRLYVHKQRLWPGLSQPSRQDGELLPGWDAQILLPAVFWGPQPYQLRQVRLQHWGPSSAHMATSRVMDP